MKLFGTNNRKYQNNYLDTIVQLVPTELSRLLYKLKLILTLPAQIIQHNEVHLQLNNTEFMTCIRRRIVLASAEEVVGKFLWWPSVRYTCSNIGLTCTAIVGSAGFMAAATSVIHANFLGVSVLMSHDSCWRRDRRTPWLNGNGTIDKMPTKSTWL